MAGRPKTRAKRRNGRSQAVLHFLVFTTKAGKTDRCGWRRSYGRPNKTNLANLVSKDTDVVKAHIEHADSTVVARWSRENLERGSRRKNGEIKRWPALAASNANPRQRRNAPLSRVEQSVVSAFIAKRKATGGRLHSNGTALVQGEDDLVATWIGDQIEMASAAGGAESDVRRYVRAAAPPGTLVSRKANRGRKRSQASGKRNNPRRNHHLKKGQTAAFSLMPSVKGKVLKAHEGDRYDIQWNDSGVIQRDVAGSLLVPA